MASSRKGSYVKNVSSSSPTVAFRSSDVAQVINKHKAEYAGLRENDRKSPAKNNSVAMSRNMNLPQSHRGGSLSRLENSGVVFGERKPKSLDDSNMLVGDRNLQAHRGRSSPNLPEKKSAVTRSDAKSEAYRLTENSTSLKHKASKRPPLMKNSSPGTVLSKTDQRVKQLNNKLKHYGDPISPIDSVDADDDLNSGLVTGRSNEQALLELNLLPEGFLPEKQIINESVVTPNKSEAAPTFKGFQTFDGSRFSPIEEASLVLNESAADLCANVVEKETETMYEHMDLFERLPIRDTLQSEVTKEHEILGEYVKMDSISPLQFSPREYNYPVNVYQDQFQSKIWQAVSEENASGYKCFTCTSEESTSDGKWSTYSSSESSSVLQNEFSSYLGEKHYSLQHQDCDSISSSEKHYSLQHQDCDSISSSEKHYFLQHQDCDSISSSILTLDLEEPDLGKSSNETNSDIFESEANKIAHQLVASAACGFEKFPSDVSLMNCNPSTLVGKLSLKHLDYEEETSLNFSLEKSLMQMDVESGHLNSKASDELDDNGNQEPLFWPLNPDSYWHDKNDIKSLQSMMDSEHQLKAEWSSVSSINTTNSLSSDNSEQLSGMQSFSGRKASAPGVGSMPSCRVRNFVHPSSEGITSKPPSQLFNDLSKREFGDQNQSPSQSKLKSAAQLMGEKAFASMGKINDSNRESSTLPGVNGLSGEAKAHSQSIVDSKKVSKLDSSSLSSDTNVSNIGKTKHAISPVSSKLSLDNTARWPDENQCNLFKIIDIKCTQGKKTSSSAALIEGCCKEGEEQDDCLTPCVGTQNWTSIYEDCRTEAGGVEIFDGSEKSKNMQCFKHDLISTSCDHAIELKAKGNLSLGLGGSECSASCIGSSGVGSSECVNPGNAGWKLTTGESFYDIPDLLTGCFESGQDSIEMLLGMKEFDGQEGIGALTDKMIPSPSDSGQGETFYSNVDCAIQQRTVQNVSTTSNAKEHGESIDFSFIENSVVFDKDTGMDLSLSSEINTAISSVSSLVPPEGATKFKFGNSTTIQELEGNQPPPLKDCCIQDYGQPAGNNGVDSVWNDDLLACVDFDLRSNSDLSALNLEQITIKSMDDQSLPRRLCLKKCVENIKGNYAEKSLIYLEPASPREKEKETGISPLLPPSQTAGNNQSLASLKEFLFSRTSGNIKYQSCGIGCSNVNSNNGRDEVSLSESETEDNKRNGVCESGLTTGSFGHHMSGEQHLYCAAISVKDSTACSETRFINAFHNWTQTGDEEFSDTFQGFLFNNPIIKSCFSGILDVHCVKLLEDNLQGVLQYLRINADNLIQASLWYQDMQKKTEDNAIIDLQSIKYRDCNFIAGERLENMAKLVCLSRNERSKEVIFSRLDKVQSKNESLYGNSGQMLKEKIKGPETEENRVVNCIHYDDSAVSAEKPMSATFLPEAKDLLSALLYFILQSGKKSIAHDWMSHNVNSLTDLQIIGMDRKVEALEAELIEIKQQNKKLESLVKSMVIVTKRLQQSSQEKKWHRSNRRPLICKFVLHPRKKKYTGVKI